MDTIHSRLRVAALFAVVAIVATSCSEHPARHAFGDDKPAENGDTIKFGLRGDPTLRHSKFRKLAKERFGAETEFVGHHLKEAREREVDEMNLKAIKAVTDRFGAEALEKLFKDSGCSRASLVRKER